MKRKTMKGRITRIDYAHAAALREYAEREGKAEPRVALTPTGAALVAAQDAAQVAHKPAHDEPQEPRHQSLAVPLRFVSAALLAAAKGDVRYYLNGVCLHAVDGEVRVSSTDGHRLIVSRYIPAAPIPDWLAEGVIVPREALTQALPILAKHALDPEHGDLYIDHLGERRFRLRCADDFARFVFDAIDGKFPDYARVLAQSAAALARGEAQAMRAGAIAVKYLRSAGDIGMKLGATAVHPFTDSDTQAAMFTFSGAPDSVLVIMPIRADAEHVPDGVVKMIGRAGIAGSIAALKAHVTRTDKLIGRTDDGKERKALNEKKADLEARIARLLGITSHAPAQLEHKASAS